MTRYLMNFYFFICSSSIWVNFFKNSINADDSQTTVSKYYFSQKEGRDGKKEENERGRKANPLHGEMTDSSSDTGNV